MDLYASEIEHVVCFEFTFIFNFHIRPSVLLFLSELLRFLRKCNYFSAFMFHEVLNRNSKLTFCSCLFCFSSCSDSEGSKEISKTLNELSSLSKIIQMKERREGIQDQIELAITRRELSANVSSFRNCFQDYSGIDR